MISTEHTRPDRVPPFSRVKSPVLLRVENLRKHFGGQIVLDNVNLELHQSEVVLLRGENGSGKTTLINILTGNLEPDAGTIHYLADDSPRSYRFPRRWWQNLSPFDQFTPEFVAREGVGRTWQDTRLFPSQPLRENIAIASVDQPGENPLLALLAPRRSARREKEIARGADAMLGRLGLAGREESSADKISLGQSKRVAIARAVAGGTRILFLDEPLAGLDRNGVGEVLASLESLVRDHKVTIVIVEHIFNQIHLEHLVTTDWFLENAKLDCNDSCAFPADGPGLNVGIPQKRAPWVQLLVSEGDEIFDEPLPHGAMLTRIRRRDALQPDDVPVLELRNLVVERGSRTVIGLNDDGAITGLNLKLHRGELVVLQAPNGWGKSTLFAALSGIIPLSQGKVLLQGRPIDQLRVWDRVKSGIRTVLSDNHSFPGLQAEEALRLAGSGENVALMASFANRTISSLSGGQKQRLALLTQMGDGASAPLRIFDEPFSMLDQAAIHETARILRPNPMCAVLVAVPSATQ